ncbi:hypothetical protein ABEO79_00095 [Micromonospora provocatoris]
MAGGLRNLIVRIGADMSQMKTEMKKAQDTLSGFQTNIRSLTKGIGVALAGLGAGAFLKSAVQDAMDFETSMNQVNRIMGSSSDEFMKFADSTAASFGYSRLEAVKTGATYGNLLMTFSKSADETRQKTEELMKATAVVSAATGRTMDDTFERIRSGLLGNTEAIEDLGINVNVAMIESTKAFQQFANGQSWDQLSFQVQQQIRYAAILEQAYQKYGSTIQDSTQVRLNNFMQALSNVRLALGQAFLPILNVVLPILTRFAQALATGLGYVGQFFRALLGKKADIPKAIKPVQMQTQSFNNLGTASKKAGDKVKKTANKIKKALSSLAGFDQINKLAGQMNEAAKDNNIDNSSAGIGGGGGISEPQMPTLDTSQQEGAIDGISAKVREFAEKVKEWLAPLKPAWDNLTEACKKLWDALVDLWNTPIIQEIKDNVIAGSMKLITAAVDTLANAIDIIADVIQFVADILNGDWKGAWNTTKQLIEDVYDLFADFLADLFPNLRKGIDEFKNNFGKFWTDIETSAKKAYDYIINIDWSNTWTKIKSSFSGVSEWYGLNVTKPLKTSWDNWSGSISSSASSVWAGIKSKLSGASEWYGLNVTKPFKTSWDNWKSSILTSASSVWSGVKGKFSDAKTFFGGVASKIKSAFSGITSGLGGSLTSAFKTVFNKGVGFINKMIDYLNSAVKKLNGLPGISGIPSVPKIPMLARGGIVDGPTLAMVGEAGREAVMPLENNTGWMNEVAQKMAGYMGGSVGGGNGDIIIQIGTTQLGKILMSEVNKLQRQAGTQVIKVF